MGDCQGRLQLIVLIIFVIKEECHHYYSSYLGGVRLIFGLEAKALASYSVGATKLFCFLTRLFSL